MDLLKKKNFQAIAIQDFRPGEGLFIRSFFADDAFNLNGWSVTKSALKRDLASGLEKKYFGKTAPIIITPDFGHPPDDVSDMIAAQEMYRVGDFLRTGFDEKVGAAYIDAVITDKTAIEMIQNGELNFVSPSIVATSEIRTGDGKVVVPSFGVNHLAIVKNPAFGTLKAQIKGRCTGPQEECLKQLQTVQASVKVGNDVKCRFNCGTIFLQANYDALSQPIQEKIENGKQLDKDDLKSLMGEDSTEQVNIEQDDEIMKHRWYDLPEAYQGAPTCVSKWIPELKSSHPEWKQDQVLAVAYSKCGESKSSKTKEGEFENTNYDEDLDGEGHIWPKNFGADFKYEKVRGFFSGDTEIMPRVYIKDLEGDYMAKGHYLLHAFNLPHTHCYAGKIDGKAFHKTFKSNYNSDTPQFPTMNELQPGIESREDKLKDYGATMTEDETYKYLMHNPGIFIGLTEGLKPISRKEGIMPDDNKDDSKDKDMEELKKEAQQAKEKIAEMEKKDKENEDKYAALKAEMENTKKDPMVQAIVQAKVKLGILKEADVKQASGDLMKNYSVEALSTMQAELKTLADKAPTGNEKPFEARYQYQAATDETKIESKADAVRDMIHSRCRN